MSSTPQAPARDRYPSDLTDAQWALVEPFVRSNPVGPQPVVHSRREVLNAILYVSRTGVQWRYLPHDFPDWQSVYSYFRQWKKDGTLKLIHDVLRGKVRKQAGRLPQPTAGILDSQRRFKLPGPGEPSPCRAPHGRAARAGVYSKGLRGFSTRLAHGSGGPSQRPSTTPPLLPSPSTWPLSCLYASG